jgi:hypothetical protein
MHGHLVKVGVIAGGEMLVGRDQPIVFQTRDCGHTGASECRQLFDDAVLPGAIDQDVIVPWTGPVAVGRALGREWRLIQSGRKWDTKHRE